MKNWLLWLLVGIIALIGGMLALLNPLSASVTAENLAGWTLLVVGAFQGWTSWKSKGFRATTGSGLTAAAALLMGLLLLLGPIGDGGVLKIFLAGLLILSGIGKYLAARAIRGDDLFIVVVVAAAVSVVLGLVVLTGIPGFLAGSFGVILGLELISVGVALIVLSLRRKRHATT